MTHINGTKSEFADYLYWLCILNQMRCLHRLASLYNIEISTDYVTFHIEFFRDWIWCPTDYYTEWWLHVPFGLFCSFCLTGVTTSMVQQTSGEFKLHMHYIYSHNFNTSYFLNTEQLGQWHCSEAAAIFLVMTGYEHTTEGWSTEPLPVLDYSVYICVVC